MAGLFAVMTAMLLAIGISIAYALVLRELRQINANLEQFIKLVVDARGSDQANDDAVPAAAYQPQSSLGQRAEAVKSARSRPAASASPTPMPRPESSRSWLNRVSCNVGRHPDPIEL